jgi:hypothetical protein
MECIPPEPPTPLMQMAEVVHRSSSSVSLILLHKLFEKQTWGTAWLAKPENR